MLIIRTVARRIASGTLLLVLVSMFVFLATTVGDGDAASRLAGRDASPAQLEALRDELNLNDPVPVRYAHWAAGVVRGDLGESLVSGQSVGSVLGPPVRNTALLAAFAFAIYFPMTVVLSALSAVWRGRAIDHVINAVTLIILSIPEFVMGTFLLVIFVVTFPLLPAVSSIETAASVPDYFRALVLPASVLTLVMTAYAVRILRGSLMGVLESDYIRMATLKGVPAGRRMLRHALPNALLPTLNVSAMNLNYLVGGVVIVEVVFRYPGFGTLLVESLSLRDTPVVAAATLLASALYVGANTLVDVAGVFLTPKLRVQ